MITIRAFFCMYLLIRLAEGVELGLVTYRETGIPLNSVTIFFIFVFAVTIVVHGVRVLGRWVALTWHCGLELFLGFLSAYWAATCAFAAGERAHSLFRMLDFHHRLILFSALFFYVQLLLAVAGAHIILWMIKEQQHQAGSGEADTSSSRARHDPRLPQSVKQAFLRLREQASALRLSFCAHFCFPLTVLGLFASVWFLLGFLIHRLLHRPIFW
jgi:hypothetical protein